jgi:hypothetical protein
MNIKDVIDKLSSYNLFNYLFPGFIFVYVLKETTRLFTWQDYTVPTVIMIYFIGLVISRVGSLVIEEILIGLQLITQIPTADYSEKAKSNVKLEIIFEAKNMYRTLSAMCIILFFTSYVYYVLTWSIGIKEIAITYSEFILFVLFLLAFGKQHNKVEKYLKDTVLDRRDEKSGSSTNQIVNIYCNPDPRIKNVRIKR